MKAKWIALALVVLCFAAPASPLAQKGQVVVYTSVDQIFSQPILEAFEKETGIKVLAVYDVEASKTTGLVNRLIAEKNKPRGDVFWNGEIVRTIVLKNNGVLTPYNSPSAANIPAVFKDDEGYWTGYSARARVLIVNNDQLDEAAAPSSIFDFLKPQWKGRFSMAYPLFGTTATHVAALYAVLGQEMTEFYLKGIKDNGVMIVDGNSVTRDLVVAGRLPVAFTDTDDANVSIQAGKPVRMVYPDARGIGTLLIPNTVGLVANGPNPENGKKLIDYLLSERIESELAFGEAAQMPVRPNVPKPDYVPSIDDIRVMQVDYEDMVKNLDAATRFCQGLFVR
jgi:iron(III) transport system substrate-binding protein